MPPATRHLTEDKDAEGFDFLGATRSRTVRVSALEGGMVVTTAA
jgi:hypothetical protein